MKLEELMLFSFLAHCGGYDDENVKNKIINVYYEKLSSLELFKKLENILQEDILFYGEKGHMLFDQGMNLLKKWKNLPLPNEFDRLIIESDEFVSSVNSYVCYSNSKIDDSFFWNENAVVINAETDEKEKKFFRELLNINRFLTCILDTNLDHFVDSELDNAIDIQQAYKAALSQNSILFREGWVIYKIFGEDLIPKFELEYYSLKNFDEFFLDKKCVKYSDNLWRVDKEEEKNLLHQTRRVPIYCGIGRITNLKICDMEKFVEREIVRKIDISESSKVPDEFNPLDIISLYIGDYKMKFSIDPEEFLHLLNKRSMNAKCKIRVSNHQCLICGETCINGGTICDEHIWIE